MLPLRLIVSAVWAATVVFAQRNAPFPQAFFQNVEDISVDTSSDAGDCPLGLCLETAPSKTIYETLQGNDHFSRLVKLIDLSEEIVSLLNDSSKSLTFFAPPNHAIPRPPRHRKPESDDAPSMQYCGGSPQIESSLVDLVCEAESLEFMEDKPDPDKRKEILKKILTAVLSYHAIYQRLDAPALTENVTYATALRGFNGSLDGEYLRVRIGQRPLNVNLYAKIIHAVNATNGVIHAINHPLLPPPSIFQQLFWLQRGFSTLTSALQRVGLSSEVEFRYRHDKSHEVAFTAFEGTPVTTFFAPSNLAFNRLPKKLQLFLFSPFGERALKKLLQYHVVPKIVFHSDWSLNLTVSSGAVIERIDYNSTGSDYEDIGYGMNPCGYVEPDAELLNMVSDDDDVLTPHHTSVVRYPDLYVPPRRPQSHPHPPPAAPTPRRNRLWRMVRRMAWWVEGKLLQRPPNPKPPKWPHPPPPPPPVVLANLTLPTALGNRTLSVQVERVTFRAPIPFPPHKPRKEESAIVVIVNGQRVALNDGVANNGALHVIHKVLHPFHRHGHHGPRKPHCCKNKTRGGDEDWTGWEEWLPEWANSDD
ncbi:FAS1 domain-containing protein [Rickenella mellea]|uniref:FAS1 domain-containing protein n=1 Tax=Rickenella mellea TaxID=50990 RepID=A0A4Y7QI38_9AGAM|nr:FAS1 domain-containing protein [Rickenella mellea]